MDCLDPWLNPPYAYHNSVFKITFIKRTCFFAKRGKHYRRNNVQKKPLIKEKVGLATYQTHGRTSKAAKLWTH